jgi:hypothetical protein
MAACAKVSEPVLPTIPQKRRRLTFSLRVLLLITTLACILLAGWSFTAKRGVQIVDTHLLGRWGTRGGVKPAAPFVLSAPRRRLEGQTIVDEKTYHLWIFGRVLDLPFATEM